MQKDLHKLRFRFTFNKMTKYIIQLLHTILNLTSSMLDYFILDFIMKLVKKT